MKMKSVGLAAVCAVLASPAFATVKNMENPLYLPSAGDIYSKTALGVMNRKVDDAIPMQQMNFAGENQFPIWRIYQDLGYGITDRLAVRGSFGWIQNDDGARRGLSEGRVGLNYRIFDAQDSRSGIVWDVYADAFLGGIDRMSATLKMSPNLAMAMAGHPLAMHYNNYSNGQYGMWVGTQLGKTCGKWTGAVYGEVQRTFGNNNNNIDITPSGATAIGAAVAAELAANPMVGPAAPIFAGMYKNGLPSSFNVDTKSTWAYGVGVKGAYQIDDDWSVGGAITYRHYADQNIEKLNLTVNAPGISAATGGLLTADKITAGLASNFTGNQYDGWDDWVFGLSLAHQFTDVIQGAVYSQYTHNVAGINSQDGAWGKVEFGVRMNLQF